MNVSLHPAKRLRAVRMLASTALLGAVFSAAGLGATAAHAEDPKDTGFTVTIPTSSPTPTPTPSATPPTPPAAAVTPPPPPTKTGTTAPTKSTTKSGGAAAGTSAGGAGGTAECTPTEPPVPTAPASSGSNASVDKEFYQPGQKVTATATGYAAGEQVQLVLFSEPNLIGTFSADAQGQVEAVFPVDEKTTPGTHTVQFTGWCKKVALADVLVGTGPLVATGFDIPIGLWIVGGVIAAAVLAMLGWRLLALMRAPAAGTP
ncbi:hypothetical protein [Conyzicola sp.]|uniref:hypothetical protein n=1 Tax=Conyzicola sp. TaxID=1969404 RepID=UPI0039899D5C